MPVLHLGFVNLGFKARERSDRVGEGVCVCGGGGGGGGVPLRR